MTEGVALGIQGLWSHCIQSGSEKRRMTVGLGVLSTLYSVQDSSLWYGVAHIQNGFPPQLNLSGNPHRPALRCVSWVIPIPTKLTVKFLCNYIILVSIY